MNVPKTKQCKKCGGEMIYDALKNCYVCKRCGRLEDIE